MPAGNKVLPKNGAEWLRLRIIAKFNIFPISNFYRATKKFAQDRIHLMTIFMNYKGQWFFHSLTLFVL